MVEESKGLGNLTGKLSAGLYCKQKCPSIKQAEKGCQLLGPQEKETYGGSACGAQKRKRGKLLGSWSAGIEGQSRRKNRVKKN